MKFCLPLLIAVLALGASMSGCSWMGRTAGKAQAKIERKADDLESGYHQGYNAEKSKSSGSSKTSGASKNSDSDD